MKPRKKIVMTVGPLAGQTVEKSAFVADLFVRKGKAKLPGKKKEAKEPTETKEEKTVTQTKGSAKPKAKK